MGGSFHGGRAGCDSLVRDWRSSRDRPVHYGTRAAWEQRSADAKFIRPGKAEFTAIPAESVDYAVMEHCPGSEYPIKMVPLAAGWSDLGAWDAVWQVLPKDQAGTLYPDPAINEVSMQ